MSNNTTVVASEKNKVLVKSEKRRVIQFSIFTFIIALMFFISAGTIYWLNAWIIILIWCVCSLISEILLYKFNPELIVERSGKRGNIKTFDRVLHPIMDTFTIFLFILPGLDVVRFRWSAFMPIALIITGIILNIFSYIIKVWSMVSNKHFEESVRIQEEREHTVCTSGPYKYVRHPGYLGFIFMYISVPLICGSYWSLIPALIIIILLITRTFLEDKMLNNELKGYIEYSKKVRYRLFPGIW
jgi:protein-S-isoprenylcysteine O-methyltransferase Ste14